jgi:hypothetical protein
MARDLYIVPRGLHLHFGRLFSNFHALPLHSGLEEIVSVHFHSDASRDEWESMRDVVVIGNEHDGSTIDPTVALKLSVFGVTTTAKPKDVRRLIRSSTRHPLF